MITIDSIITDIKSDLRTYDEAGLIDDVSLEMHLINELKRFGGNVMDVHAKVFEIRNSQTSLPKNFFSLYKAIKTEPIGYGCENEEVIEELNFGSTFYRVRKEASVTWDNLSGKFTEGDYTQVTEKVYLGQNKKLDIYYGNHKDLKLVKGFDKSKLDKSCENLKVKSSPYEISIINNTLQTNFSTGFICLYFKGLRVDDETEAIVLPEDPNARLYEFLVYSGKAKVFEMLWSNDDDPNVQTKLQYFNQKMEQARTSASAQVRFESVSGKTWWHNLKQRQRRRTRIFEL